ncbi:MAG: response regulator [Isosphaeraceae bacterium]
MNRLRPEWFEGSQETIRRGESSRILIADDEANCRLGFRVALETAGYVVIEAQDGEEALEFLRDDPADLALIDLRMPILDGMETLRRLRDEGIDVPVVILTAHGSVPSALRAMDLGAIDFLAKPVEPATLRQTVFQALIPRTGVGTEPYRPAPSSLAASAHRFAETLALADRALRHGQYALAEELVSRAIDLDPCSIEAQTLLGALREGLGEHHAAYHAYRKALTGDPHHGLALDGMRRYCQRFGLDANSKLINPGAP